MPGGLIKLTKAGARVLLCLVTFLILAAPATADPRWWWNDALVAPSSGDIPSLDVDVADCTVWVCSPLAIWVAWVDDAGAAGGSVMLSVSFDHGCSFCTTSVLSLPDGAAEVALAVVGNFHTDRFAIHMLVTDGTGARVVYDTTSVPLMTATPAEKCAALTDLAANRTVLTLSDREAGSPDIIGDATMEPGQLHFHAVWRQSTPGGQWEVHHARDLVGAGAAWEARGSLTDAAGRPGVVHPAVSMDLLVDGPPGISSVNVAFVDPGAGEVLWLRSADSGTNFSATGDGAPGPPAIVNDPASGQAAGLLALDSGRVASHPDLWHGLFWYEMRGPELHLLMDGQYQVGAAVTDPSWQDPDPPVGLAGREEDGPALAVTEGGESIEFPGAPPGFGAARTVAIWTDASPGGHDLYYRAGLMDAARSGPIDLDAIPFLARRPQDPAASTNQQLTGCSWDEGSWTCVPDRPAGRAVRAAMDEDHRDVYLAWVDDRNGQPELWFKRTDDVATQPFVTLSGSCPTPDTRRITASWSPSRCASPFHEKVALYPVYYGTDPGGPYLNAASPIVVEDDGSLPDPVEVDIDGLDAGVPYFVIVVAEDEARNIHPNDFDPLADGVVSPSNEEFFTTPTDCDAPCADFSFGSDLTVTPGDCRVDIEWDPAQGESPVLYEVQKGAPIVSGLSGTSWTDTDAEWGASLRYMVQAQDSCADPTPRLGFSRMSAAVFVSDLTPPQVGTPTHAAVRPCTLEVDAAVTDSCSGPGPADILRDGVEVAVGAQLPYEVPVPLTGPYSIRVRGYDRAGNSALSEEAVVDVPGCGGRCLYRKACPTQDTTGAFTGRDPGTGVAFAGPDGTDPHGSCPFLPDDADPEPVLEPGSPVLIFYQVEGTDIRRLRITKDVAAGTVRIQF